MVTTRVTVLRNGNFLHVLKLTTVDKGLAGSEFSFFKNEFPSYKIIAYFIISPKKEVISSTVYCATSV